MIEYGLGNYSFYVKNSLAQIGRNSKNYFCGVRMGPVTDVPLTLSRKTHPPTTQALRA
jgi:hypothetical protein